MQRNVFQTNQRKGVRKNYKVAIEKNIKENSKGCNKTLLQKKHQCVSNGFIGPREQSYGTQGGEAGLVSSRLFR